MNSLRTLIIAGGLTLGPAFTTTALGGSVNLLTNGNLDKTQVVEITPGFFLPKPASWVNEGLLANTGPYEGEMSSEPWAGPAPTPVTGDGVTNPPPHNQPDYGVFFQPFDGNGANGGATGHLYQDVPGIPGAKYTLTGWAGAEQNALMAGAVFVLEFRTDEPGGGSLVGSVELDLKPTLKTDNGQPFDYKQYTLEGIAPAGTEIVRVRASMLGGTSNPQGGGQAFVVDDFTLTATAGCAADINGDGVVDGADLGLLLGAWGECGE